MIPEDQLAFFEAVWTRRTLYTFIFLGINIAIFLLMALAGGSTNEPALMAFGVKSNPEIAEGQWWRFITPIFIHIGLLHLLFNSYALWMVGPQVEKLYGGARFVILYVLTGVAGVAGSYFYHPQTISAGASGAIFGLFGVLLTFGIRYRNSIPPAFKQAVGTGLLPVIIINLIIGFTIPMIDNAAHISGLIAGIVLALVFPFQRPGEDDNPLFQGLQVSLLILIGVSFYQVAAHYDGPRLSLRNLTGSFTQILGSRSTTQEFIEAINAAEKAFDASVREINNGAGPGWTSVRGDVEKSIDQLRRVPSLASDADKLAADLLAVMQDQYELLQDVERAGTVTFAHNRRLRDNSDHYQTTMSEFFKWVDREGRKHGIERSRRQ